MWEDNFQTACALGYGWKKDLVKELRNLGFRGRWGTEILLASQSKFCRSERFLADNEYRNNDASPLFSFATQKICLCVYQAKCSPEWRSALTRLRVEWSGSRIPDRIRYLTLVRNVLTSCGGPSSFPFDGDRYSIPGVKRQGCTKSPFTTVKCRG